MKTYKTYTIYHSCQEHYRLMRQLINLGAVCVGEDRYAQSITVRVVPETSQRIVDSTAEQWITRVEVVA